MIDNSMEGADCKTVLDTGTKRRKQLHDESLFSTEHHIRRNGENVKILQHTCCNNVNQQLIRCQHCVRGLDNIEVECKFNHKEHKNIFVMDDVSCKNYRDCYRSEIQAPSSFGPKPKVIKKVKNHLRGRNYQRRHKFQLFQKRASKLNKDADIINCASCSNAAVPTFKNIMTMFLKKSSIYTLNQIGNSKTCSRKLFWSFIMIGGLLGCGSQIYRYLNAFYSHPVIVNIDSISKSSQVFPAVTVCNLNAIRKSFVHCFKSHLSSERCNETMPDKGGKVPFTTNSNHLDCSEEFNMTCDKLKYALPFWSWNLNLTTRKYYGHQAETFIISCTFNRSKCSPDDFVLYHDMDMGNCYTFNKGSRNVSPSETSLSGPEGGLELELNLEIKEYLWVTETEGARVIIHDPYKEPNPLDDGINVDVGHETTIAVSMTTFLRLPPPFKDQCRNYELEKDKTACEKDCFLNNLYASCSCYWQYPSNFENARYCDLNNDTDLDCLLNAARMDCNCPLECNKTSYGMKMSSSVWPSKGYSELLFEKDINGSNISLEDLRATRLKIKVYYETLQHLIYEQKSKFENGELLSQIGGQMGLWLGLSLVFVFEWVENFVLFWKLQSKKHH